MNGLLPIVADIEDVLGFVVMVVFVIIAVVSQIMGKLREAQQQQRGPGQAPKRPKPLEDEIRQFLRGAMEKRGGPRQRPQQGGRPRPAAPGPADVAVEAEVVAVEPLGLREQLEAQKPRKLGSSLGEEVARADDEMASRLHGVFDHKLGSLEGRSGDAARQPSVAQPQSPKDQITPLPTGAVAGLAAVFANAESIRQAVLIQEVLQRPEHRWE